MGRSEIHTVMSMQIFCPVNCGKTFASFLNLATHMNTKGRWKNSDENLWLEDHLGLEFKQFAWDDKKVAKALEIIWKNSNNGWPD